MVLSACKFSVAMCMSDKHMATSSSSGTDTRIFHHASENLEDLQTPHHQSYSSLPTSVTRRNRSTDDDGSFGSGHQSKAESDLVERDSKGGNCYYFFNLHLVPDASTWESKMPWIAKWALQEHARLERSKDLESHSDEDLESHSDIFVETARADSWTSTAIADDIQDFYSFLVVGLDHLGQLFHSVGMTHGFLLESILLLQSANLEVSNMMDKLSGLRDSQEFVEVCMDYSHLAEAVLSLNEVLYCCASLLTAYNSYPVESAIESLESLISMPDSNPRTLHAAQARKASSCISFGDQEMRRMQKRVREVLASKRWNHIIRFVPDLRIKEADSFSSRCRGLAGVILAQKNVTAYISRLLLSGLAYGGDGPLIKNGGRRRRKNRRENRDGRPAISSNGRSVMEGNSGPKTNITKSANEEFSSPYQCSWSVSLMSLHTQVSKGFANRDISVKPFMLRDTTQLQHMLGVMKRDLEDFLDQAKFFSMGYLGSWKATKKTLRHNVKILRQQQVTNQAGLVKITTCLDSLVKSMMDNERRWKSRNRESARLCELQYDLSAG